MAEKLYEIPLIPGPQSFSATMRDFEYLFRITYRPDPGPGWLLDLSWSDGTLILAGMPMVPGVDLLERFPYLQAGVKLFVYDEENPEADVTYAALGRTARLFYYFDDGAPA